MKKILVIDDEPEILKTIRKYLELEGYKVLTAENGQNGIEIFQQQKPILIITDVKMPGMNGIDLLKKVKEIDSDTEVIVITGHGDLEISVDALRLDASDFISKPVDIEHLLLSVERALSRHKMRTRIKAYTKDLERLLAEQKNIMETVSDGICMLDLNGNIINCNRAFNEITSFSAEELIDKPIVDFFTKKDRAAAAEAIKKGLKKNFGEMTGCLLRKNRQPAIYHWRVIPLKDPFGNVVGLISVGRDITEQKRIEQEVNKNQNLESIGVLAGGIAHDFNNILTIILGNITISKIYTKPEDRVHKNLIEIEKGVMRAKDLTRQLLTFSKGGAPVKETISITKFLKESATFALSGSNVKCIFSIPNDIWAVKIDKGQINQVVNNIMINADQSMPEGGRLEINLENVIITSESTLPLQKGKYIKLSFKDHGIGIPSHHLNKIFDPYFSTKTKGNGLGLASAYSIIKNHKGLITVESELKIGTIFYIYLPASEKIIIEKEKIVDKMLFGKEKILIMDDDDLVREVTGEMVKNFGYSAEFSKDGAEAIKLYKNAIKSGENFSAIIMDLTIPGGMGGKEAAIELLKIDPEVKMIASSGYSKNSIMSDYKKYGFIGILAKPYKISELGEILQKVINT